MREQQGRKIKAALFRSQACEPMVDHTVAFSTKKKMASTSVREQQGHKIKAALFRSQACEPLVDHAVAFVLLLSRAQV